MRGINNDAVKKQIFNYPDMLKISLTDMVKLTSLPCIWQIGWHVSFSGFVQSPDIVCGIYDILHPTFHLMSSTERTEIELITIHCAINAYNLILGILHIHLKVTHTYLPTTAEDHLHF